MSAVGAPWVPVGDWLKTAAVGDRCTVLIDHCAGGEHHRAMHSGRPRYRAVQALLYRVSEEGPTFTQWRMPDGGPLDYLDPVTHVVPMPAVPDAAATVDYVFDEDAPQ